MEERSIIITHLNGRLSDIFPCLILGRFILAGYYDKSSTYQANVKSFLAKEELIDLIAGSMKALKRRTAAKVMMAKVPLAYLLLLIRLHTEVAAKR